MADGAEQPKPTPEEGPAGKPEAAVRAPGAVAESPVLTRARQGLTEEHATQREAVKQEDTAKRAEVADEASEAALLTGLDRCKAALEADISAVEATIDSDGNNAVEQSKLAKGMTDGRAHLREVDTEIRKKIDAAKTARGSHKYAEARAHIEAAQELLQTNLANLMMEQTGESGLSDATQRAINALRDTADAQGQALSGLFETRYASLDVAPQADAGTATASVAQENPATTLPEASSATPDPLVGLPDAQRSTVESLLRGNPLDEPLADLETSLSSFKPDINWAWMNSTHDAQVAARDSALTQTQTLRGIVDRKITDEVRPLLEQGNYAEALVKYAQIVKEDIEPALEKIHNSLTKDNAVIKGMAALDAKVQTSIPAAVAQVRDALDALSKGPPIAAPTEESASPEATSESGETAKDPVEVAKQAVRDGIAAVSEGYAARPPKLGKIIAGAFQLLVALTTLWEKGDVSDIGAIFGEYFDDEEVASFKNPKELLKAVGVEPAEVAVLTSPQLTMEQLYTFYEWKKDSAKPAPQIATDLLTPLEAFHADNPQVYQKVMEEIFEKQGGKAYATDPDKKKHSVFRFFGNKLSKIATALDATPETSSESAA